MKEKILRFMYGRYGTDQLSKFMLVVSLILLIVSSFTGNAGLYILSVVLLVYMYFRMFSKNVRKRYEENMKYLKYHHRLKNFLNTFRRDMTIRKTHHIYRCPNCSQKIKIPRHKGRVAIKCPKCYTEFIKNS